MPRSEIEQMCAINDKNSNKSINQFYVDLNIVLTIPTTLSGTKLHWFCQNFGMLGCVERRNLFRVHQLTSHFVQKEYERHKTAKRIQMTLSKKS
jgi:hypothetical protein